jgi:TonB family protein
MTSLRLFETRGALSAEDTTWQLFKTPPLRERYQRGRWPYASSVVLHAMALVSVVSLARYLVPAPPPPTPAPTIRNITSTFVLTTFGVDNRRPRRSSNVRHPKQLPVTIQGNVAAAPAPDLGESRVEEASPIAEEKPQKSAFDPPLPTGEARVQGRHGDPSEAGLGSATVNVRGSPTAEVRPGGLGEGSVRGAGNGGSVFSVRPGFDDGAAGGGATPPRIQEPLPIPDYPADARTRRLQGVVVLEVMLDTVGKAHVRGVLSRPLGFGIEEAARNAAERLKFTPARQGGRSVDAIVQVRVTFTLTDGVATAVTGGA